MRQSWLEFEPGLFVKVLAVVFALVVLGIAVVVRVYGDITTTDLVGTLICAPLVAYLVHLWLQPQEG
ncbi:MAG: hypothetical protein KKB50_09900 [Planctomycetes bacterium]|nr:hypothetical protein [Planctomycetota bacterium]